MLTWALEKPLDLGNNPSFIILKEQKYLIKHILQSSPTRFSKETAETILGLMTEATEYKLMKPVDLDLYIKPTLPILQIAMPVTQVRVARNKGIPQAIKEGKSVYEMCIPKKTDNLL